MAKSSAISDYVDILGNIASNVMSVQTLISGFAYFLGILFVAKALMTLKEHGEQRTMMSQKNSMKEPLIYFVAGGMLLFAPTAFKAVMETLYGTNASIIAYGPLTKGSPLADVFYANSSAGASLVKIVQTIGLVAFVRGWVLIARAGSQGQAPGGMGKGFIHVIGGVLAINIVGTIDMINNTIYGT